MWTGIRSDGSAPGGDHLRRAARRTSSVWAARPSRPVSSCRTLSDSPTPCGPTSRDRVEVDPLARRLAHQVDRQLGVDEQVAPVVERGADAVAGVGGDEHPRERRRRLAGDERLAHPQPHPRRAGLRERALRGTGSPSPCGSRRPGRWGRTGARRPASGPGGGGPASSAATPSSIAQPPRDRARDRARRSPPASVMTASTSSTLRPGRTTSLGDGQRRERHRAQDLDRDPADQRPVGLDGTAEQRRGRPGVLRAADPTGRA